MTNRTSFRGFRAAALIALAALLPMHLAAANAVQQPAKPGDAGATQTPATSQAPATSGAPESSRDLSGIIEEQELLRRQLQRLRRTMESLIPRLEEEGRTRALELLREGLVQLDLRSEATRSLTLEELMDQARQGLSAGQSVQSLESQEAVVQGLERLLAILLDRESLDGLETSLEALRAIQNDIKRLSAKEQELETATAELKKQSASAEQQALSAELERLSQAQRELLAKNEAQARASGALELEQLERELETLIAQQKVDREVLESWNPREREALKELVQPLEEARRSAERAARLRGAAKLLRETAQAERRPPSPSEDQARLEALDTAAERAERQERAAGDESARAAAEALRASAAETRQAGAEHAARERAAGAMEQRAAELEKAAGEHESQAGRARTAASEAAAEAERDAKGETAKQVREALERALSASPPKDAGASNETRDADAAARETEDAARAVQQALEDSKQLGPALSGSQEEAAQSAERLERGVRGLPENAASPSGAKAERERAASELARAAEAMRAASRSARSEDSSAATQAARGAEESLNKAREALGGAREAEAKSRAGSQSAQSGSLAAEQRKLAAAAAKAGENANSAGLSPEAQRSVDESIAQAKEAMERASEQMESGQSATSASSQRQAVEALQKAQASTQSGVRPSDPSGQAKSEELAQRQKAIEKELLDLATRNEQRKNSKPSKSLPSAASKASQAGESLSKGDLEQAESEEEEVEQELDRALEELSDEEEEYQRLRQEELLFHVTEEVAALLESHKKEMAATREIDAAREAESAPSRADRLRLRRLSEEEAALGAQAGQLAAAIEAEQSLVFAQMLHEVEQDLARIARDLGETGDYQTGERVQALQEDVQESLVWVLEALQRERENRQKSAKQPPQGGPQGKQQDQKQRLVPDVAELKLLRRMEVETLDRVNQMLLMYPELATGEVDGVVLEDIQRLAERHERITTLFQKFRTRLGIPPEDEALEPSLTEKPGAKSEEKP